MNCRPPRQIGIAVGLVSAVVLAIPPSTRAQGSGVQAFTGATLIDGNGARIDKAVLVIRDGRVVSAGRSGAVPVPKEARQIPLAGKFVVPGLISAHVHVSDVQGLSPRAYTEENTRRQLGVFARYGITTVLSLGGEQRPAFAARDAQGTATLDRSRIYLSGEIVIGKTAEQARQMVASVAETRPDIIKIRVDDNLGTSPKMTPFDRAAADVPPVFDPLFNRTAEVNARGLRLGEGEGNTPERMFEHDRLLRDDNFRIGGGIAYSLDKMDVFFSYFQLLQGNDSHGGRAITAGVSWPFEIRW